MTQILLSCIPLIIFIIIIKILKIKVENPLNIGLLSFVTIVLVLFIFNKIFSFFIPASFHTIGGLLSFIYFLFYAGISEETSKYISVKLAKPQTKSQIIITSILIALLFGAIENYGYYAMDLSHKVILIRIADMHILFGCIMGYLLVLGKEKNNKLYDVLALIVPIIMHSLWDFANGSDLSFIIGGIICYASMILMLIKAKEYQKTEELSETKDNKKIIKIIILVVLTLAWLIMYSNRDSRTSVGSICKYNDLEIKVLEAEKMIGDKNNPYIRVKVNVKNNSSTKKELDSFGGFKLVRLDNGEKTIEMISLHVEGQRIDFEVNANDSNTGYLFFDVSGDVSEYKLTYKELNDNTVCNMSIK